jgi:molecular chaperone GrpE
MEDSGKIKNEESDDSAETNDESTSGTEPKEERGARMNAAKAFYRAMYAGEDVVPDEFGLGVDKGGGTDRSGPCANCAYLEQQFNESQAKATEMENLYKRMAADFENYRRRLDREREEFAGAGIQKAIEAILPAMDDLDRAKQTLTSSTDPKAILESLNLVYTRFTRCLEGLGIKPLEVIGQPFDPRMHEPVQEIETNQFEDGAVMHELRKGYSIKDKILRPTLVNVASNPSGVVVPPEKPAETATEAQAEAVSDKSDNEDDGQQAADDAVAAAAVSAAGGGDDDSGNTLDALNSALANLVGADEEKGAESQSESSPDDKAGDAAPHTEASHGAAKGKKQKVYDISDAESEAADQGSLEKR